VDGRTDMTKQTVNCCNFGNVPRNIPINLDTGITSLDITNTFTNTGTTEVIHILDNSKSIMVTRKQKNKPM
jgi:hypothetical protein